MAATMMGGRGSAGRARATHTSRATHNSEQIRHQVIDAYRQLTSSPGGLVSLVRLRNQLKDLPREDLDRVLKEMDRARLIQLEPDPNRKALPQQAKDAAIQLGGEPKHFLFINDINSPHG